MSLEMPTREQFIEAARALWPNMTDADLGHMYDLLTGPPEPFAVALGEWTATRGLEIARRGTDTQTGGNGSEV